MPIEYCLSNVDQPVRTTLRSRPDTREATCLEHCGRCVTTPFLVVDGALRTGPDHDSLLRAVDDP